MVQTSFHLLQYHLISNHVGIFWCKVHCISIYLIINIKIIFLCDSTNKRKNAQGNDYVFLLVKHSKEKVIMTGSFYLQNGSPQCRFNEYLHPIHP
jgi:hypothetical protein